MTDTEKDKIIRGFVLDLWDRYSSGAHCEDRDFSDIKYDWLHEQGFIKTSTPAEHKDLMDQATRIWKEDQDKSMLRHELRRNRGRAEYYRNRKENYKRYLRDEIMNIAKRIKLKAYFARCKDEGVNLRLLITK